jgi:cytochrome c553
MKFARWAGAALIAAIAAPVCAAGDAEAGRIKANTCMGCHGIPNYNNVYPTYRVPKIGGQGPQMIISALKAYKAGDRPHLTMQAQAANLSDQDMADIAAYLERDAASTARIQKRRPVPPATAPTAPRPFCRTRPFWPASTRTIWSMPSTSTRAASARMRSWRRRPRR